MSNSIVILKIQFFSFHLLNYFPYYLKKKKLVFNIVGSIMWYHTNFSPNLLKIQKNVIVVPTTKLQVTKNEKLKVGINFYKTDTHPKTYESHLVCVFSGVSRDSLLISGSIFVRADHISDDRLSHLSAQNCVVILRYALQFVMLQHSSNAARLTHTQRPTCFNRRFVILHDAEFIFRLHHPEIGMFCWRILT